MIYFVLDNKNDIEKLSFLNDNSSFHVQFLLPKKHINTLKELISYSNEIIKLTSKNDVIIFWYDFIGIMSTIISFIKGKKRKILILNILLKNKKNIKNKICRILYRFALNKKNVIATTTSKKYGYEITKLIGYKKEFFLLRDVFNVKLPNNINIDCSSKKYIFSGGRNGRNWNLLINIANFIPNIEFHFVMSKEEYNKIKKIPKNIKIMVDIDYDKFIYELANSAFVVMPLNTNAPAGLLMFFQAARLKKLIITTKNNVTEEYFSDNRGVLCGNSEKEWVDIIKYYYNNEQESKIMSKNFLEFLENECSTINYKNVLINIVLKGEQIWQEKN